LRQLCLKKMQYIASIDNIECLPCIESRNVKSLLAGFTWFAVPPTDTRRKLTSDEVTLIQLLIETTHYRTKIVGTAV
jgi:hypothetical protein